MSGGFLSGGFCLGVFVRGFCWGYMSGGFCPGTTQNMQASQCQDLLVATVWPVFALNSCSALPISVILIVKCNLASNSIERIKVIHKKNASNLSIQRTAN